MSDQYDNELKGVLFKNDRQREGKKDPNAKGSCTINGKEYWISAWTNTSKEGQKYQSLKFSAKEEAPVQTSIDAPPAPDDFDDDIPF